MISRIFPLFLLLAVTACAPLRNTTDVAERPATSREVISEAGDPAFLYLAAQQALHEGHTRLAITLLEQLVEQDPHAIEPRAQLAELLVRTGQYKQAGKHVEALLGEKLSPEHHQQLEYLQIRLFVAAGQMARAEAAVNAFLSRHPKHLAVRKLQVQVLLRQGNVVGAKKALKQAIRIQDSAELRLMQARILIKEGNLAAAKRSLRHARNLDPDNEAVVLMQSQIALQEKHPDQAEEVLRSFLEGHPRALRAGNELGRLLVRQNRLTEAIRVYEIMAQQTGGAPEILKTLGLLYYQLEQFQKSEHLFRQVLERSPSDEARFYLGVSLEAQKRDDEATIYYQAVSPTSSYAADAQLRLAGIEARQKQYGSAIRRLKQLIRKKPKDTDAYLLLSEIRLQQKDYAALVRETEPATMLQQLPDELLMNRAIAFEQLKQYDRLEHALGRLLKKNPRHADALNFLGYSLAERGLRLDEAERLVLRALEIKPDDGYFLDSLAWVYFKQGKYEQALKVQERAINLIADDPVMQEHLGDIYWKLGRKEQARQSWRKALKLKSEERRRLKRKIRKGI